MVTQALNWIISVIEWGVSFLGSWQFNGFPILYFLVGLALISVLLRSLF